MRSNDKSRLALSLIAGFFSAGAPFWLVPYAKANLPNSLLHPGLFVVAALALWLRAWGIASFWRATLSMAASVGAAVAARAAVGIARDPTSHNLWPLEVIIALLVGLVCAAAGAALGISISAWRASAAAGKRR